MPAKGYLWSIGVFVILSLLPGCASRPEFTEPSPGIAAALEAATIQDTEQAYVAFLDAYDSRNWHDADFKGEARSRLGALRAESMRVEDDAVWNRAASEDTIPAYQSYLDRGFERHEDAANRGIVRRSLHDAAQTNRAHLVVTQRFENAPADFSMPLIRETAEAVFHAAGIEIVVSETGNADPLVPRHSIDVTGSAWQQNWHIPSKNGAPAVETVKLHTGYRIDVVIATSVNQHRIERKLSIDASAGESTALYSAPTLSPRDLDGFREAGGIFDYSQGFFGPGNAKSRYEFDHEIRRSLISQLLNFRGCEIGLVIGSSTGPPRGSWSESHALWADLYKAISDKPLTRSASNCELVLDRICTSVLYSGQPNSDRQLACSILKTRMRDSSVPDASGNYTQTYREQVFISGPTTHIVTEVQFQIGKSGPISQRCYAETMSTRDQPGTESVLAEAHNGEVVYLEPGNVKPWDRRHRPESIDQYCRFSDGIRLRP